MLQNDGIKLQLLQLSRDQSWATEVFETPTQLTEDNEDMWLDYIASVQNECPIVQTPLQKCSFAPWISEIWKQQGMGWIPYPCTDTTFGYF